MSEESTATDSAAGRQSRAVLLALLALALFLIAFHVVADRLIPSTSQMASAEPTMPQISRRAIAFSRSSVKL